MYGFYNAKFVLCVKVEIYLDTIKQRNAIKQWITSNLVTMTDLKNIHIGHLVEKRVLENKIGISRICRFLNCSEKEINQMYASRSIDSAMLLRWSKLLKYDFFRIYSQHIMFYSSSHKNGKDVSKETSLPQFRKNIYTKEIIDFILDALKSGEKTKKQIIEDYKIPKTTLYKWISKYDQENNIFF